MPLNIFFHNFTNYKTAENSINYFFFTSNKYTPAFWCDRNWLIQKFQIHWTNAKFAHKQSIWCVHQVHFSRHTNDQYQFWEILACRQIAKFIIFIRKSADKTSILLIDHSYSAQTWIQFFSIFYYDTHNFRFVKYSTRKVKFFWNRVSCI